MGMRIEGSGRKGGSGGGVNPGRQEGPEASDTLTSEGEGREETCPRSGSEEQQAARMPVPAH